jgi:hypothetical protein
LACLDASTLQESFGDESSDSGSSHGLESGSHSSSGSQSSFSYEDSFEGSREKKTFQNISVLRLFSKRPFPTGLQTTTGIYVQ